MSSSDIKKLECDYLVIGSGATGMAFVDELVHNNRNIKVILVDKRAKPGGHWVDAYPFVRLHQPAAWYGVNSRILGSGGQDLATKAQILAYYELVMEDLKATGRLTYFPQCEYMGEAKFKSLIDENLEYEVNVLKKMVDATLMLTHVPSTKPPEYAISENVNLVPLNKLVEIKTPYKRYVVIGAGKTGLDALLFLLDNNVSPEKIVWVVSNDCWYFSRDLFGLNGKEDLKNFTDKFPMIFGAVLASKDLNDAYKKGEEIGMFMRLDKNIWPTKMRAATVSKREMEKISTVENIIRHGRIERIESDKIIFHQGDRIPTDNETLHIDCSAAGTKFAAVNKNIFDGNHIHLQMIQVPQPCTSAAMIGALELKFPDDDDKKNSMCVPMNAPQVPAEWYEFSYQANVNGDKIGKALGMGWMRKKRLSMLSHASLTSFVKVILYMGKNKDKINEKMKLFGEQGEIYGKFDS